MSWFGGEPLAGPDVIEQLSEFFLDFCAENDIEYAAGMTTNGYLLDPATARRCVELGVRHYQITLDGPRHTHDFSRTLMGGAGTFDVIKGHLRHLADSDLDAQVLLRTNFTPKNVGSVPELLQELGEMAAHDPRFKVIMRPVGRWGGAGDDDMEVCTGREGEDAKLRLYGRVADEGLGFGDDRQLRPGGSVCYAANPWSLVVRPNGIVSKCTVALTRPENMVGRLTSDGDPHIDLERLRLWTENDEAVDSGCQSCRFRPSCQGAHGPLIRIQEGPARARPRRPGSAPTSRPTTPSYAAEGSRREPTVRPRQRWEHRPVVRTGHRARRRTARRRAALGPSARCLPGRGGRCGLRRCRRVRRPLRADVDAHRALRVGRTRRRARRGAPGDPPARDARSRRRGDGRRPHAGQPDGRHR
ncbi:radical SAM protein [Mariniluteicoccus endophyticus]